MRLHEYEDLRLRLEKVTARQQTIQAVRRALPAQDLRWSEALACAWAALENKEGSPHEKDKEIVEAARALLPPDSKDIIAALEKECSKDDLRASILFDTGLPAPEQGGMDVVTPALSSFVLQVLKPEAGERVLSLGGGRRFMESLFTAEPDTEYIEVSHNERERHADILRASLLDFRAASFPEHADAAFCEKAFALPVFSAWRDRTRIGVDEKPHDFFSGHDVEGASANWNEIAQVLDVLRPGGTAVILVPTGVLISQREAPVRRFLTDKGLLQSVAALPGMLLEGTAMVCALLVLQYVRNQTIHFVDGLRSSSHRSWNNPLPREAADALLSSLREDSSISAAASPGKVRSEDYDWSPVRYLFSGQFENAQPLGGLVRKIQRGSQLKDKALEQYKTVEPTNVRCIRVADLRGGILRPQNGEAACLTSLPPGMQPHVIPDKAVVLTKVSGGNFSSAVAENTPGIDLVATGNLYVLDLDQEKLDPYYLQAFFASENGSALLRSISSGTLMLNLSQKELMRLQIPVPPMEKQHEIGDAYRRLSEECAHLRDSLAAKEAQLKDVWH